MKLIIREDGSGSELDLFDVEPVMSVHDVPWTTDGDYFPVTGIVQGSIFRSMRFCNRLFSLMEWEGIAYAAWLNETLRRGMYADHIPDVGESWTAKKGGEPITWPDWMKESWLADVTNVTQANT